MLRLYFAIPPPFPLSSAPRTVGKLMLICNLCSNLLDHMPPIASEPEGVVVVRLFGLVALSGYCEEDGLDNHQKEISTSSFQSVVIPLGGSHSRLAKH